MIFAVELSVAIIIGGLVGAYAVVVCAIVRDAESGLQHVVWLENHQTIPAMEHPMTTRERRSNRRLAMVLWALVFAAIVVFLALILTPHRAHARDNGQYAQVDPAIRQWFNGLKGGDGHGIPCCSYADGRSITDADWDTEGDHYRARVDGQWYDVPPEALVTGPNKVGTAVVWPWTDRGGVVHIRCFIPGSGT
jgi:hypothetical protein